MPEKKGWGKFDLAMLAEIRDSLAAKARDDPDFWSFVGVIELRMYIAIADQRLAAEQPEIEQEFEELFARQRLRCGAR